MNPSLDVFILNQFSSNYNSYEYDSLYTDYEKHWHPLKMMQLWRIHLASARNASVHPYSFFLTFYNQTYTDMFWPPYNICLFVLAVQNKYEIWIKRWCSYIHSTCSCNMKLRGRSQDAILHLIFSSDLLSTKMVPCDHLRFY